MSMSERPTTVFPVRKGGEVHPIHFPSVDQLRYIRRLAGATISRYSFTRSGELGDEEPTVTVDSPDEPCIVYRQMIRWGVYAIDLPSHWWKNG